MIHQSSKDELSRLHRETKSDVLGLARNAFQIILFNADKIALDSGSVADLDAALVIAKTARRFLGELEALLAERNVEPARKPDAHLGAEYK